MTRTSESFSAISCRIPVRSFPAANGREALERMQRQRPRAVLLEMPVMDGREFRRHRPAGARD
jgi:CheY-like chemotaxis protein